MPEPSAVTKLKGLVLLIKDIFVEVTDYSTFFKDYKKNRQELNELKSKNISSEIFQFENKELKELINDYVSSSDKILAKIIVDKNSPFLKSIIIGTESITPAIPHK